jgi:hypothetical protein
MSRRTYRLLRFDLDFGSTNASVSGLVGGNVSGMQGGIDPQVNVSEAEILRVSNRGQMSFKSKHSNSTITKDEDYLIIF